MIGSVNRLSEIPMHICIIRTAKGRHSYRGAHNLYFEAYICAFSSYGKYYWWYIQYGRCYYYYYFFFCIASGGGIASALLKLPPPRNIICSKEWQHNSGVLLSLFLLDRPHDNNKESSYYWSIPYKPAAGRSSSL